MQLPQNKQDRQKALALIAVGIIAALYGLWAGVYQPVLAKKADAINQIADLQGKIENADRQIRRIPQLESDLREVLTNLAFRAENQMLYPRLGNNYLLPVREKLSGQANALGLETPQVDEIGLVLLPKGTNTPASQAVRLYAVRVTAVCSYEDLRKWFVRMENDNPTVAPGNVMITSRPEDPEMHQVTFEVHFPVWMDAYYGDLVQGDLANMDAQEQP